MKSTTPLSTVLFCALIALFPWESDAFDAASFAPPVDVPADSGQVSVAFGDLDGDGKPDAVAANYDGQTISVYRNTSTAGTVNGSSFAPRVNFPVGSTPVQMRLADVDGDGKLDIVVVNQGNDRISLLRNLSTGGGISSNSFAPKVDLVTAGDPRWAVLADFNGDGKPDLAVACFASGTLSLFQNNSTTGVFAFGARVDLASNVLSGAMEAADLDGDGKRELVIGNADEPTISIFKNIHSGGALGTGSFAAPLDLATASGSQIILGDVDGDGKTDIVTPNSLADTVSVLRNTGSNGVINSNSFAAPVNFPTGGYPYNGVLADLDGDGRSDLVIANSSSHTLSVYRNLASSGSFTAASFAPPVDYPTGNGPRVPAVVDVDGDGQLDLINANLSQTSFSILPGVGTNRPPSSGPVAWWPLQGDGLDVSGRNHPLTLVGQPIFGDGEVGQAMVFDGSDDSGRAAAHPDLDLGANEALTLELWINPASASQPQPLLEWTDNASLVGLHFWISVTSPWSGGGPRSLFANVIDRDGVAHHVSSAPGVLASNAFTHVAFTYSKNSGLAKLYADGQLVATTNLGRITPETRAPLYTGWRPLGGGQYRFAGKLDEISLYARELSQAELNTIFVAGVAGKPSVTNEPPVVVAGDFNAGRDFTTGSNPNGVWSYGWQSNVAGAFTPVTHLRNTTAGPGVAMQIWEFNTATPPYFLNFPASNTGTGTSDGGFGQYPPGTLIAQAGGGTPYNLATIRFTAPSNGNYRVSVAAHSYLDGGPAGDTDFHVARNGTELFGQFLPAVGGASYTNILTLATGDTIDFATGRGADNNFYGSGLKIAAVVTPTTNAPSVTNVPPVVVAGDFNLVRDFSTNGNPAGVWSYGWQSNTAGVFTPVTHLRNTSAGAGVAIQIWEFNTATPPYFLHFPLSNTATGTSDGGFGQYPPGTLIAQAGAGTPHNLATIRFTAPSNGNYRIGVAARSYLDGGPAGDTDFHVARNGLELFGQFLPSVGSAAYTNTLSLAAGDTIDFASGRGADNNYSGSGLKIAAVITPTTNAPVVTNVPPVVAGDFNLVRDFSTNGNPHGVWSYGWQSNVTSAFLPVTHLRNTSAGPGVAMQIWEFNTATPPYFLHFPLSNTATGTSDGGSGQYPPGTLIAQAGGETPYNLATIRFTAPSNGNYRIGVAARSYLDGGPAGDTDFHVVRNGTELFGQFLPAVGSTGYTNILTLVAGDKIDFATGRGSDNNFYGSGLKIAAVITPTTNTPPVTNVPPVVVANDYNVSRDFSVSNNPAGAWSYGWKGTLGGSYSNLTVQHTAVTDNGVAIPAWLFASGLGPVVYCNTSSVTGVFEGGAAQVGPGTVWYYPGPTGSPQNYGVIRFTAPSNGNYQVTTAVRAVYDGAPQGDTDFHVLKNGTELFGRFLTPTQSAGFTGVVALAVNDVVDFAIGRGTDNNDFGSGLKIAALITPTTNAPPVTNVPPVLGLVSLWPADGNANDAVGPNHGSLVQGGGFVPGVSGQAFRLDGTNFIRIADAPSLRLTNALTMQLWFKAEGNLPSSYTLFDKRNFTSCNYGGMLPGYGLVLYYQDPASGDFQQLVVPRPSVGVWHHFAGTYQQLSNGVRMIMYLDGAAVATSTRPGTLAGAANQAPLALGVDRDGLDPDGFFKGAIDEVALYNYALSPSQVLSNYHSVTLPGNTNVPPVVVAGDFNLVRDFSTNGNPAGVWSYGWQSNTAGVFTPVTHLRNTSAGAGVAIQIWEFNTATPPYFLHFPLSNTATGTSDGGFGQYPPGTLIAQAGAGTPHNLATIRFTAPSNGNYRIGVAARSYLDGGPAGDTDFHVARNGLELFGQFLPSVGSAAYTNTLSLAAGDTIDFASGRGADNNYSGSGLKIAAVITPTTNAPAAPFSIISPKMAADGFGFTFNPGVTGPCVVEFSENLVQWTVLTNIVCTNASTPFRDLDYGTSDKRFYRIRPVTP